MALSVPAEAFATKVAVAAFTGRGKNVQACATRVTEFFRDHGSVTILPDESAPAGSWQALSSWVTHRGSTSGADVMITGTVTKHQVVLAAYSTRNAKLLGMKNLFRNKGCRFSSKTRRSTMAWLNRIVGPDGLATNGVRNNGRRAQRAEPRQKLETLERKANRPADTSSATKHRPQRAEPRRAGSGRSR